MSVNRWWHADFITAFYEETLGDALADDVLQKSLVENARISRSTLRGLGGLDCDAGERAGSSGGRRCESRSGGNHRSRPLPAKPPTSTVETIEQLDGDAARQINCRLGAEGCRRISSTASVCLQRRPRRSLGMASSSSSARRLSC